MTFGSLEVIRYDRWITWGYPGWPLDH